MLYHNNMNPTMFKTDLAACVAKVGLGSEKWGAEEWKTLGGALTQEILDDAFARTEQLREIFSGGEFDDTLRPAAKELKRAEKKLSEQYPGRENYFKVVSDLLAVRLQCDVANIPETISSLKAIFEKRGSEVYLRGASPAQPLGAFKADRYIDIFQFMYVYDLLVGYIIEIQVGHPFAFLTFSIDSALREDKNCGLIDLWNDGFYGDVKAYILQKANGEPTSLIREELLDKGRAIHGGTIPSELLSILSNL